MLSTDAKNQALERLKKEVNRYEERAEQVRAESVALFDLRQQTVSIIEACEHYLTELANAPRELKKSVAALRTEFDSFVSTVQDLEKQSINTAIKSGGTAAGGVATGVGVAAFAPTAAMAIATTFGTASTGTAIASLSGAAATNAALAWLGGGALAAGGGGMAAGQTLLALAGPVGWAIGGAALIGAGGYTWYRNSQIAEDANNKAKEIHEQVLVLDRAHQEICELQSLTKKHKVGVREQLRLLQEEAPLDYTDFTTENKQRLGALINSVNALAELINRQVEIEVPESTKPHAQA